MIQGGYISAIVTSIQTHFNFSTSKVGFILSSYDIMSVLAIPILSYMGTRYNKSKIIGICGFSYVLGAILFTFPYFFTNRYNIDRFLSNTNGLSSDNPHEICRIHTNTTDFPTTTSNPISFVTSNIYLGSNNSYSVESFSFLSTIITETATTTYKNQTAQIDKKCQRDFANTWPYYIFILAQLFMSLGTSPIFSLGITYICDNLRETYHAFCTGKYCFNKDMFHNYSKVFFVSRNNLWDLRVG
jgi:MFS family permease